MNVPLPPLWVRRLLIDPLVAIGGFWLLFMASPAVVVLLLVSAFATPITLRVPRLIGFAIAYLGAQVAGLWALFGLWIWSGFGARMQTRKIQDLHYGLLRFLLSWLMRFAEALFSLRIEQVGDPIPGDDGNPHTREYPLLVMSRHAGPGDSFLVVHELLSWAGRRPRIVLKDTMQIDPFIDVCFNRLPMKFLDPGTPSSGSVEAIAELSRTMGDADALVIFPEGGNVTPSRRRRAIDKLRASGLEELADRAEHIEYLMPPRPAGVAAALEANDELAVVVVAHTGLDTMNTPSDIWRELPQDKVLHMTWKSYPSSDIEDNVAAVGRWLFDRWEEMDAWVAEHMELRAGRLSGATGRPSGVTQSAEAPEASEG